MSKEQDRKDTAAVTMDTVALTGHMFHLGTTTLPDGQLEGHFADGSTVRGSKEILCHAREFLIRAEHAADPRTVDADGFLLRSVPGDGPFGLRRGFGGISSLVGDRRDRVGLVVGMDSGPGTAGLRLAVVWVPGADPAAPLPDDLRESMIAAHLADRFEAETVAPYGLRALDVCTHQAEALRDRRELACACP